VAGFQPSDMSELAPDRPRGPRGLTLGANTLPLPDEFSAGASASLTLKVYPLGATRNRHPRDASATRCSSVGPPDLSVLHCERLGERLAKNVAYRIVQVTFRPGKGPSNETLSITHLRA
jgi:hypothetical protein